MTSLRVICGLGPPQSKILATPIFRRLSYYSLQASDVAQLLAKVATGCNLSRAVEDVKFWLLRVQSERTLSSSGRMHL